MVQPSDQPADVWQEDDGVTSVVVQASGQICPGRCKVYAILPSAVGGNLEVRAYDGHDNGGDLRYRANGAVGNDIPFQPIAPWLHTVGLYVEFTAGAGFCTVVYRPDLP